MEVPRHWRIRKQRYAMVGEVCANCKNPIFPPRPVCPRCAAAKDTAIAVSPVLMERVERLDR